MQRTQINDNANMDIDFSILKLVIWDLDDTFWTGTLSEEPVNLIDSNVELIKRLTDCGVVNSVCSKNDRETAEKTLEKFGVAEYFVFNSIDWTPKGQRVSKLIKDMGLRAQNCLFIDDNIVNLNEALYYEPTLMVAAPSVLPEMMAYFKSMQPRDTTHKRLDNYKILEKKTEAKFLASDNLAFLYDSDTRVKVLNDCLSQIDRIYELVHRTNQLNYTKLRSTKDELVSLIKDSSYKSGYVKVRDKYGDYGIVGFYAVRNNQCVHFLFSCRTIGQGIEQYVYALLGYPKLEIVGEVVNPVTSSPAPAWINQERSKDIDDNRKSRVKVIIKGACDLNCMSSYIQSDSIIEEFTYIGRKGNNIEHRNHSVNYLTFPFLSEKDKQTLLDDCIFSDEGMFDTAIYDKDVSLIFVSTMIEPNLGIYRNKSNGLRIAFGEYLYPLTDPKNWDLYIEKKIFTADIKFTKSWLESFREKYEFEGNLSPVQILENIKELLRKITPNAKVCVLLGSETPYEKNSQPNYANRHLVYKEINNLLREYALKDDRLLIIDFNWFIRGQEDFTNNINHFQRRVYYEAATKANSYISCYAGATVIQKSRFYLFYKTLIDKIGKTGFYQTRLWRVLRIPYVYICSFHKK